jgi:DNA-binding NarL/FixJ family response regulator
MDPVRVLIVDDHPVVRTGLRGMLAGTPEIDLVGEASDGQEAVLQAQRLQPDVILMDLRLPGLDGVAATTRIKQDRPATQVIILTTYDSDGDILRAIEAGAIGYLLKDTPRDELFRAIHAAAQNQPLLTPSVAARLMNRMRTPADEGLSGREIEVLGLVARGNCNKEVARALSISEATVKTHLNHIFQKLAVTDRTSAVTVALERGILRLD